MTSEVDRLEQPPLLLQAIVMIEAAACELLSCVALHRRSAAAAHLRAIAALLESDDPLIHRPSCDARLLDECVGNA